MYVVVSWIGVQLLILVTDCRVKLAGEFDERRIKMRTCADNKLQQYGDGENCYKMVEITYNGKTAQAQIVDEVRRLLNKCFEHFFVDVRVVHNLSIRRVGL